MKLPTIDRRRSESGFGARKAETAKLAEASRFTATVATVRDATKHLHEGGLRVKRERLSDAQAAELIMLTTKTTSRASDEDAEPHASPGFNLARLDARERRRWEQLVAIGAGAPESYFDDRRSDAQAFEGMRQMAVTMRKPARRMQDAPEGSITLPREWIAALEPSSLGVLAMLLGAFESGELPAGTHPDSFQFIDDVTISFDTRHGVPWGDSAELYGRVAHYEDGTWAPTWKDALLELAALTPDGKTLFTIEQGRTSWTLHFNRATHDAAIGAKRKR